MSRTLQPHIVACLFAAAAFTEMVHAQSPTANDAIDHFRRGNSWFQKEEYDKAIADYSEAIRLNPKMVLAYTNRGSAWKLKEEYEKAIADYSEAIRLNPNLAMAYTNRGNTWIERKEYAKAITDLDEALRLDPKLAMAYQCRGSVWHVKKEDAKATADYSEAIRLKPDYLLAYIGRGIVWNNQGQSDKAITDFDEAIRLEPENPLAYLHRGLAWTSKKVYDMAIADYGRAIRLNPGYTQAYHSRGVANWLGLRDGEAIIGMKDTLERGGWRGKYGPYATILGYLSAVRSGKLEEARKFLQDYQAKGDMNAWPEPVVRYLRGMLDENSLLAASSDDDRRTESHAYLGFDLLLKTKPDEAKAHFLWVKEHGNRELIEYTMSVAELDRLVGTKALDARP